MMGFSKEGMEVGKPKMMKRAKWVHFTSGMIKGLEEAVKRGYASDMNSAIRDAVRDYLKELKLW